MARPVRDPKDKGYTKDEDFTEADLVVSELGDPPNVQATLETIRNIVEKSRP